MFLNVPDPSVNDLIKYEIMVRNSRNVTSEELRNFMYEINEIWGGRRHEFGTAIKVYGFSVSLSRSTCGLQFNMGRSIRLPFF